MTGREKCETCLWRDGEMPDKCARFMSKECLANNPNYYESEDNYYDYLEAGLLKDDEDEVEDCEDGS